MSITKKLGGDRLGSGKKQKVELHGYERSTHDLSYVWRSTMAAGTLIPFLTEIALPADTFDIELDVNILTHPTIGPLFGSYKIQLDIFQVPIRLYNAQLHNNKLGIGMHMEEIYFPVIDLVTKVPAGYNVDNINNSQVNPSSILAYLNINGIGYVDPTTDTTGTIIEREFNAIPLLAYWEIYKNYYANKQEENAYVIHNENLTTINTVDSITFQNTNNDTITVSQYPAFTANGTIENGNEMAINFTGTRPLLDQIIFVDTNGIQHPASGVLSNIQNNPSDIVGTWYGGTIIISSWGYAGEDIFTTAPIKPIPSPFTLANIDTMRENILAWSSNVAFNVNNQILEPYSKLLNTVGTDNKIPYLSGQEGLALKTYQSDLFNNWIKTEFIEQVSDVSKVIIEAGAFTIDQLNLSYKVYKMLNRIAVSGGSYNDWLDVTYAHKRFTNAESPIYHGGLIRELEFQQIISNAAANPTTTNNQPLGTLAGRGVVAHKKKGGRVTINVDEPSYIMGIISLTPRIDYSQGNKWDTGLITMNDLHKPQLDEIGFQDLITEQMAWFTTNYNGTTHEWELKSAGKQPAWLNYMTNVNITRGNFAIINNEMFMTLNRRYEINQPAAGVPADILDLTTYVDPNKFNFIFAQTAYDAQNFWAQIAVGMEVRRKMSAKIMPNL